jgi:hypothetical protein
VSTGKFETVANAIHEKTLLFMSQLYKNISREDLVTTLNTLTKMDQNIGGFIQ